MTRSCSGSTQLRRAVLPLVLGCLICLAAAAASAAGAGTAKESVFIVVKKTAIRKDRQFSSPSLGEALFREKFVVLGRQKDWVRVSGKGVEGWLHVSATAATAVSVSAKEATGALSQDDVAFASKGFDADIEKEYRKGATAANFGAVDGMERLTASEQTLAEFRQAGHLRARGGQR
jgi:hypothetical protein